MVSTPPRTESTVVDRGPTPDVRRVQTYGRASGMSGITFAALFVVSLVLLHRAPGLGVPDQEFTAFYAAGGHDVLVTVGLYLVPFAGIAFLWHLAASRSFFGAYPVSLPEIPRFLQQVSGVLFVCMIFAGTASVGAVALLSAFGADPLPSVDVARALSGVGYGLIFVYAVRAAGMYMITSTTMARKLGLLPGWLALLGYLAATFLLVSTTFHPAVLLVFPAWVLAVSAVVLIHTHRARMATLRQK